VFSSKESVESIKQDYYLSFWEEIKIEKKDNYEKIAIPSIKNDKMSFNFLLFH
jgi:hypothetical protein